MNRMMLATSTGNRLTTNGLGPRAPAPVIAKPEDASGAPLLRAPQVLVVEDDPFLSLHMEVVLSDGGMDPIGVASSVDDALALLGQTEPDAAVLDVNLRGAYVFPVADALHKRGVPFVFVSAYASDETLFPKHLRNVPRSSKPVDETWLIETLTELIDERA